LSDKGSGSQKGIKSPYKSIEPIDNTIIQREKEKERKLRNSAWWMRKTASGVCYYCGRNVGRKHLTMDHVIPLSRGGKSTRGNLVPACKQCNNMKKYLLPIEWEDYMQRIKRDFAEKD